MYLEYHSQRPSHRGIVKLNILRSILDRPIFNDEYEGIIDKNLIDINVGGRKERNIGDNIFVNNAVLN